MSNSHTSLSTFTEPRVTLLCRQSAHSSHHLCHLNVYTSSFNNGSSIPRSSPSYMPASIAQLLHHFGTIIDGRSKVLDVFKFDPYKMSARFSEIKSRFRRSAIEIHPDHYASAPEKFQQAGKSMRTILRAMKIVDAELQIKQRHDSTATEKTLEYLQRLFFKLENIRRAVQRRS